MINTSQLDNAKRDIKFFEKHLRGFLALAEAFEGLSSFQKEVEALGNRKAQLLTETSDIQKNIDLLNERLEQRELDLQALQEKAKNVEDTLVSEAKTKAAVVLTDATKQADLLVSNAKGSVDLETERLTSLRLESNELTSAIKVKSEQLNALNRAIEQIKSKL